MESPPRHKFRSTYSSLVDQYPHQASSSQSFLMDSRPDSNSSTSRERYQNPSVDETIRSNDRINKSASEDFQYAEERRGSMAPETGMPETEQPTSPIISDVVKRRGMAQEPRRTSKASLQETIPARSRYDYGRSQEDLRESSRTHLRSRSQPSSSKPRRPSHSRRPPPPVRKPSGSERHSQGPPTPDITFDHGYGVGDRSSGESIVSQDTAATSVYTLPPLQTKGPDNSDARLLEPVVEDDPRSWDLIEPADELSGGPTGIYALEKRSELMFSSEHLRTIFNDPKLLLKFTGFLNTHRPKSIAILIYYLDALKALRAINYANAVAEALDPIRGHEFTQHVVSPTRNSRLEEKAEQAFEILAREDLAAFIAYTWIQVVSVSIQRRITGTLAPHLREASEGLAEVFCLTDPSRPDNPIVFTSEEFVRTTQYGMNYVIGRNCRFLQGPKTNPHSVRRLAQAVAAGKEHTEVFVNYRRDGSPFMNLLMTAPSMDSRGNIRYYIGAQVDVSNLVKECSNLDGLMKMVEMEQDSEFAAQEEEAKKKDEFHDLTEMFNGTELETVRKYGGRMHKEYVDDSDRESVMQGQDRRRLLIKDLSQEVVDKYGGRGGGGGASGIPPNIKGRLNGKLEGVYQHVSGHTSPSPVHVS